MVFACPTDAALSVVTSPALLPQKAEFRSLLACAGVVLGPGGARPALSARDAPGIRRQS